MEFAVLQISVDGQGRECRVECNLTMARKENNAPEPLTSKSGRPASFFSIFISVTRSTVNVFTPSHSFEVSSIALFPVSRLNLSSISHYASSTRSVDGIAHVCFCIAT
jgi:hypothetical protein